MKQRACEIAVSIAAITIILVCMAWATLLFSGCGSGPTEVERACTWARTEFDHCNPQLFHEQCLEDLTNRHIVVKCTPAFGGTCEICHVVPLRTD